MPSRRPRTPWAPPPVTASRLDFGTCPDCGKLRFTTRATARKAGRQAQRRGVHITRVYRCGDYWHWTSQDAAKAAKMRRWASRAS
jgi:hypothetical protein